MCRIGSTWKATTHYVLICFVFVGCILVPLAYHTYATWLVVRLGAKGAVRTFAFCVELAILAWMAANVLSLVWYSEPSLFGSRARQKYDTAYRTLSGPRTVSNIHTYASARSDCEYSIWSVSTAKCAQPPRPCSKDGLPS